MIRRSWTRAASIEETLALWAASLREIKTRIRPLFRQERVATNAGLFLEGLLGDEATQNWLDARRGSWRSWPLAATGDSRSQGIGMLMVCVILSAIMSSSIWRMTMRSW